MKTKHTTRNKVAFSVIKNSTSLTSCQAEISMEWVLCYAFHLCLQEGQL